MPLDIPDETTVFVDANILYYAVIPTPPFSEYVYPLMDRLSAGKLTGVVSFQVLADAQHKLMMSMLAAQYGLSRSNLVGWAKRHPAKVQSLTGLKNAVELLQSAAVDVVAQETDLLVTASQSATEYGILTNDATIVAQMNQLEITHLATNDDDFDRVPGITVWKPRA